MSVRNPDQPILVICGPTASGKSALAMRVAEQLDGEIVSADSMQIYRGFDIGTAKPSPDDQKHIPHHMIDCVEPTTLYSVARYIEDATPIIDSILERGKVVIICGGTGQYINALLDGIAFIPIKRDPALRKNIEEYLRQVGVTTGWEHLAALDPEASETIASSDIRRITRFFEVYYQTGMTRTEINRRSRERGPQYRFQPYLLMPKRDLLYDRINRRVLEMIEQGLIEEVRGLVERWPDTDNVPAFQGIGYREMLRHLNGEWTHDEAIAAIQQATRRYAKRQMTWFRARSDLEVITDANSGQLGAGLL